MKIANFGLDIQPGKYKYIDSAFDTLVEKFQPQKKVPYGAEFIGDDLETADAIVFDIAKKFDFVFFDLEKVETRLGRTENAQEKDLLVKLQELLEKETLLCDVDFSEEEKDMLKTLQLLTYKPCCGVTAAEGIDTQALIKKVNEKAKVLLFFTAGKKEVHVWDIKQGETIIAAAGKIHSDLARGFIKGEVVNARELDNFFNMAEAKAKGLVKVVNKNYLMEERDIIEIRFSV